MKEQIYNDIDNLVQDISTIKNVFVDENYTSERLVKFINENVEMRNRLLEIGVNVGTYMDNIIKQNKGER